MLIAGVFAGALFLAATVRQEPLVPQPVLAGAESHQPASARASSRPNDAWTRYRLAFTTRGGLPTAEGAQAPGAEPREYTWDWDFDEGVMVGVNHDFPNNHQLQLSEPPSIFPFLWIALSGRYTIAKVDTITGRVLGEYWSRPNGRAGDPSRTTVDLDGNVWVGNRAEASPGSIVRIGLLESGQCVDRNGNGQIDTSSGLGDVLPWPNDSGADDNGGVSTAADECIINYLRVPPGSVRSIAVDARNDVWVGGFADHVHVKVDSHSGRVVDRYNAPCGGYGGLIDGDGVLWSAGARSRLLWFDPQRRIARCLDSRGRYSYGLAINTEGYVFNSGWKDDTVVRYSPSGMWTGEFPTGGASDDRGVAITPADGNIWVANSAGSAVSRLDPHGKLVAVIAVGKTPTGMAVDQAGKVWTTNMHSDSASRIDPATNRVDLTVDLGPGAQPYNYSDMTGLVARSFTTRRGTWLVIHDSGVAGTFWGTVTWTSWEPNGTRVAVRARAAESVADLGAISWQDVANGVPMELVRGRYLQVEAILTTEINHLTPILYDLTVWPAQVTAIHLPIALKEECPLVAEHADVALILDASTSMLDPTGTGESKLAAAQAASRVFLSLLDMPADRAGLVAYNDQAYLLQSLTGDRAAVLAALDRVRVDVHTRTDLALTLAKDDLLAHGSERPANRPVIVLLTDGLSNPVGPDQVLRAADAVKAQGSVVFTIGIGTDVNADLLRGVASSPAHYYASPSGDNLESLYRRIAPRLPCPGAVFWPGN